METSYNLLEWDSAFFGYKVASVDVSNLDSSDLKKLIHELAENDFRLAYCFVNPDDIISAKAIVNESGFLADEKVTYYLFGYTEKTLPDLNIRPYSLTYPDEKLINLALQSGIYSRFYIDKNFKNNEFRRLYEKWIADSVDKSIADECLVYFDGEEELGFITISVRKSTGYIGLIAVDEKERGKSIGRKLLISTFDYFRERKIDSVEVVTQKANKTACGFYEKFGFKVKNIINIYHLWIK